MSVRLIVSGRLLVWFRTVPHRTMEPAGGAADTGLRIFLVLNWVFLFKSFEETSVTIAISVYHLAPVLVLLLGSLIYREKLHIVSVTSIVICFLGTALISGINGNTSFSQLMGSGIIWAVLAALFYAFTTLAGKGINSLSPYAVTCLQTGLGVIILLPFVRFGAFSDLSHVNWIMIVSTGIIHTGIVYLLFLTACGFYPPGLFQSSYFLIRRWRLCLTPYLRDFAPTFINLWGLY